MQKDREFYIPVRYCVHTVTRIEPFGPESVESFETQRYRDVQFTFGVNGSLLGRWYRDVQLTLGVNGSLLREMIQGCTVHTLCEWVFSWGMVQGHTVHTWCEWVFTMGDGTRMYSSH